MVKVKKMKKNIDTYIGIFLIVLVALKMAGILNILGITQRFVDIVLILTGLYLVFLK